MTGNEGFMRILCGLLSVKHDGLDLVGAGGGCAGDC